MKLPNMLKSKLCYLSLFLMIALIACEKSDIIVAQEEDALYETKEEPVAFVISQQGEREFASVEFRDSGKKDFIISLSKPANGAITANLVYDQTILSAYNEANNSAYKLFPESLVSISGSANIETGVKASNTVTVTYKSDSELSTDESYVIPIRTTLTSGNAVLSEQDADFLLFVKNINLPRAEKENGLNVICFFEVNDTNPLNALCFTLEKSKKPLIDMVVLFSANINYSSETGRVYVFNNENVTHILENREKYIKPLQDRGIKVILSILGNHDKSGIANLSDETARQFAQELKNVVNAYGLDGIFLDDEYSDYQNPPPPGFVVPSSQAASRLAYEIKKAMPDKLLQVYVYGKTTALPSVDNVQSGTFVDQGIHDYRSGADLSDNYPGMPKTGMILYSQEFARNNYVRQSQIQRIVDGGYGGTMVFAMDPNRSNFSRQMDALNIISNSFFGENTIYNQQPYSKDW